MDILLAQPRGFCAGVNRAIEIVERALDLYGAPVYVLHEIVHNKHVLSTLSARGARFVESLESVPEGAVTIFSAHGVSNATVERSRERGLRIIDATCPLVTKVHLQAQGYVDEDHEVVLVGHVGHPEVEGTRGRTSAPVHVLSSVAEVETLEPRNPDRLAYVTQTTLSVDDTREVIEALKRRFPTIKGPELKDICYATQNRQNAVKQLASSIDILLVVGSENSSNSNRLVELGRRSGKAAYLVDGPADIDPAWFSHGARIGITAGASAPEVLVEAVGRRLAELGFADDMVEMDGEHEATVFRLPPELEDMQD